MAQYGGCEIVSVLKGASRKSWYAGNTVHIQHENGFETKYGHGKNYNGEYPREVKTGEYLMYMGSTGLKSSGDHLHLEVWKDNMYKNPYDYFQKYIDLYPKIF